MTVDIAAVAEEARRVQVEPFGASVGHSAAAVWEKAARELAQERDALAAQLADGETRVEWAYRSHWRDGTVHLLSPGSREETARYFANEPVTDPVQVSHRSLVCRTVHTGPWIEVPR